MVRRFAYIHNIMHADNESSPINFIQIVNFF